MPQFLVENLKPAQKTAEITGPDAKHITSVFRLADGDKLVVTDGRGKRWRAEILSSSAKKIEIRLLEELASPAGHSKITLAQAVIKHDRLETIIQKSVELGVSKIIPFTSSRTIPHFGDETSVKKHARWQKIAQEAAKQCGASVLPVVGQITTFENLIKLFSSYENIILFYEGETKNSLQKIKFNPGNTLVIIGPEGGFSPDDVEKAIGHKAVTCGLGPLILRVETASLAAITLLQERLGYFSATPL